MFADVRRFRGLVSRATGTRERRLSLAPG